MNSLFSNLGELVGFFITFLSIIFQTCFFYLGYSKLKAKFKSKAMRAIVAFILSEIVMFIVAWTLNIIIFGVSVRTSFFQLFLYCFKGISLFNFGITVPI